MALWNVTNTFAAQSGAVPASQLDTNFQNLSITPQYATAVSGSNVIAITVPLSFAGYADGMVFNFVAAGTNTISTPSLNVNGVGALTIVKENNLALAPGDLTINGAYSVYCDGSNFHLMNPSVANLSTQNKIINPGMVIDQRSVGTGYSNPANGDYTLDRWVVQYSGVANPFSQAQSTSKPSGNYSYSLLTTVVTQDNAIAAGDFYGFGTRIEGYDAVDLIETTFTLGFWVLSSIVGTFCVSFRNSASTSSYVAVYTINNASTWEYKTITVSGGLVSSGTWLRDNQIGVRVFWALAAGSTYQTTGNVWAVGNYLATSAQTNWMATAGNTFRITGVQLSVGTVLPAWVSRPYEQELALCQRYYQKSFGQAVVPAQNAGNTGGAFSFPQVVGAASTQRAMRAVFPVTMRATPTTVTTYNPSAANAEMRNATTNTDCSSTSVGFGDSGISVSTVTPAGSSAGDLLRVHWTAEAEL